MTTHPDLFPATETPKPSHAFSARFCVQACFCGGYIGWSICRWGLVPGEEKHRSMTKLSAALKYFFSALMNIVYPPDAQTATGTRLMTGRGLRRRRSWGNMKKILQRTYVRRNLNDISHFVLWAYHHFWEKTKILKSAFDLRLVNRNYLLRDHY